MDPTRWKLKAEAFRLWLPVVVSLCAISLTIYQAAATRRHQRLSVEPRLEVKISVASDGSLVYALANNGFGPAVLKDITLTLDGAPVGPDGLPTCAKIDAALSRSAPEWDTSCFDKEGDFIIPAGDTETIYASRRAPEANGPDADQARRAAEEYLRVGMTGTYCSFYDECFRLE